MTIEVQKGVTSEPPTETQAVNGQPAESTAQEQTAAPEQTEQSQEAAQESTPTAPPINADLYDERGVPWKNVALEHRRKFEESQSNLPKLIAEEVAKLTQPAQRKYSIAELEQFAQANPEHRAWVEEEKAKVLQEKISAELDAKVKAQTKAQQDQVVRQQSFQRVVSEFPQLAIKDQSGNFLSWNNADPMTPIFANYMSKPEFQVPGGDLIAAKCAYADYLLQKGPQTAKQMQSMKSQLRKAQAQTFVEGGGRKPGVENPVRKALERASSGKVEDAAVAMGAILRKQGLIKE